MDAARILSELADLKGRVRTLEEKVRTEHAPLLEEHEDRLDQHDAKLVRIEEHLGSLDRKVTTMAGDISRLADAATVQSGLLERSFKVMAEVAVGVKNIEKSTKKGGTRGR